MTNARREEKGRGPDGGEEWGGIEAGGGEDQVARSWAASPMFGGEERGGQEGERSSWRAS